MTIDIRAFLFTERGQQESRGERQGVGIGVQVTYGQTSRSWQGYGFASDGDFPRAYAVDQLLRLFPSGQLIIHTPGLSQRLELYRAGNGLKVGGKQFIGAEHLAALLAASSRLKITKPPVGFSPEYQKARHMARAALVELEGQANARQFVPVVLDRNCILDFNEVSQ